MIAAGVLFLHIHVWEIVVRCGIKSIIIAITVDKLYRIDDGEYCEQCALERLEVVE
jgi:hypothetical protein